MILTIGYADLTPAQLANFARKTGGKIIDCRAKKGRSKMGFGTRQLEALLGSQYEWRGNELGGFGNTTKAGIDRLRRDAKKKTMVLLCACGDPHDCHRHIDICEPHFPDAQHIFGNVMISAKVLQTVIDDPETDLTGKMLGGAKKFFTR